VVAGVTRLHLAGADQLLVERAAQRFAIVVRRVAPLQEAEALHRRELLRPRIGRSFLEPAERSGAGAAEHDAVVPALPEHRIDALRLPDRLLIERVAAGADDGVHRQEALLPGLRHLRAGDEALLHQWLDVERRTGAIPRQDAG